VKNHDKIERRYVHSEHLFKQKKSLKHFQLEKMKSVLSAWFKQACKSNAFLDGTPPQNKPLHMAAYLGITNLLASNGWIDTFKIRHDIVYRTLPGETNSADPETVQD
jgi:hypothetical protein